MKKTICLIISILLIFVLSSCRYIYEVIPKEYASWDNNYIYLGNGRSKTTGEDYEELVSEIVIDDITYSTYECLDYIIKDDDIYMILTVVDWSYFEGKTIIQISDASFNILLKYNIKNNTVDLIYNEKTPIVISTIWDLHYCPIELMELYENIIVIKSDAYSIYYNEEDIEKTMPSNKVEDKTYLISIDYSGNVLGEYGYDTNYKKLKNGYIVVDYNGYGLYYRKDFISEKITIVENTYYLPVDEAFYIKNENTEGLSYICNRNGGPYLEYYSFNLNKIVDSIKLSDCFITFNNNEYINEYELTKYSYLTLPKLERKTVTVYNNNYLYKLGYSDEKIEKELIYTFENNSTTSISFINNQYLYYYLKIYSGPSCENVFGGRRDEYKLHDFISNKTKKIDSDDRNEVEEELTISKNYCDISECGNYQYFIFKDYIKEGYMSSEGDVYYLKRYDKETGKIEIMQFWISNYYNPHETTQRFCVEMFDDYYENDYQKTGYPRFIILNY